MCEKYLTLPNIQLIAIPAQNTGLIDIAIITTLAINKWNPEVIALIGICAGRKGKVERGDVIIPSSCFHYQIGSFEESKLQSELRVSNTDSKIIAYAKALNKNRAKLQLIHKGFYMAPEFPSSGFNCHVGTMASAELVVKDNSKFNEALYKDRKTISLDMESYSFMHTCELFKVKHYFTVKSVTDFGDNEKNDEFRDYAKYTSTSIFIELVKSLYDDESILVSEVSKRIDTTVDKMKSSGMINSNYQFSPSINVEIMNAFIETLSPTQKKLLVLWEMGKDNSEISSTLNLSSGSVAGTTDFFTESINNYSKADKYYFNISSKRMK